MLAGTAMSVMLAPSVAQAESAQSGKAHKQTSIEKKAYSNLLSVRQAEKLVEANIKLGSTAYANGTLILKHPEGNGAAAYEPAGNGGTSAPRSAEAPDTYVKDPFYLKQDKYDPYLAPQNFHPDKHTMFGYVDHESRRPKVTMIKFNPLTMEFVPYANTPVAVSQVGFTPVKGGGNAKFTEFDFNMPVDPITMAPKLNQGGTPDVIAMAYGRLK